MADVQEILSIESSFSATPADSSNVASASSTPPTTVSPDSMSLASESDAPKPDIITDATKERDPPDAEATPRVEKPSDATVPAHHLDSPRHDMRAPTPVSDAIAVAVSPLVADSPVAVTNAPASAPQSSTRPRRARASEPIYNLSKLLGTDHHGKRRANGDLVSSKRRSASSAAFNHQHGNDSSNASTDRLIRDSVNALDLNWSLTGPAPPNGLRPLKKAKSAASIAAGQLRRATRQSGVPAETLATKLNNLSKRGRKTFEKGVSRMSRELRRLQDTNEFAHIDERPVRYTVWSNGKYIDPDALAKQKEEEENDRPVPPAKRAKLGEAGTSKDVYEIEEDEQPEAPAPPPKRVKRYLEKGLYAGQKAPADPIKSLTPQERKKLMASPDLMPPATPNKVLPMPIFNGFREILNGRDFKLPRSVMNPLPSGQPKPPQYRTLTKNRFIGEASAIWKKSRYAQDSSTCICKPEDGCGEDCQNRIMLYECDDRNCNISKDQCQNRAFQDLAERTKKGGPYRIGVDVVKTADRGFGVRSNRGFAPGQIIMEYTGEIITVDECERRMNEEYKDNECYYLMSFDQNMIIDATTGSAARFVNHSCSPNCRMIKWIVSGQPRMALFAGDEPISPGDELTYDYNFDPFSLRNVQKCLCGSSNCRGVLGPKSKEIKKSDDKKTGKGAKATKGPPKGKRKLKDLLAGEQDDEDSAKSSKKRKTKAATGLKRSLSSASLKVAKGAAKGAATVIRRSVSSITIKAKKAKGSPDSAKKSSLYKRRSSTSIVKSLSKSPIATKTKSPSKAVKVTASRRASYTIVAAGLGAKSSKPKVASAKSTPRASSRATPKATPKSTPAGSPAKPSSRKRTPSRKVLESVDSLSNMSAASSKSPKPRTGLELPRKLQIRLVHDD